MAGLLRGKLTASVRNCDTLLRGFPVRLSCSVPDKYCNLIWIILFYNLFVISIAVFKFYRLTLFYYKIV